MKILFIFGTRPEAIKLAPVITAAKKESKIKILICLTAQHRHMLDSVIRFFDIDADYDLNLMQENQDLWGFTARAFKKLGALIRKISPDWVVVQGDTTSSFVGAMSAFYNKVKVAHVEAGLRTNQRFSPFPEEVNRILIGKIADLHFAPGPMARMNLIKEGVSSRDIKVTGNTGIDALFLAMAKIKNLETGYFKNIFKDIDFSKRIILITGHRRESFGKPFRQICSALNKIARSFNDVELVYPVHLNPNVRKPVFEILNGLKNLHLLEPLDYPAFIWLMSKAFFILTDSGGIQEEAPSLGKPVLILRESTERKEGIKADVSRLVGTNTDSIIKGVTKLLTDDNYYSRMSRKINLYGDGKSSNRILQSLLNYHN